MTKPDNELPAARRATNVMRTPPRQWFVDYLPVTGDNNIDLLVNGRNFGESLYAALEGAKSEVLLTGLHFHPQWRLVRNSSGAVEDENPMTLLNILRRLAKDKVKIYLLVNQFWANEWTTSNPIRKAIKKAGNLDWYLPETSVIFEGLREFDNVQCRTDVHQGFIMSTHHQKTVIIDKKVCFVGGIDLTLVDGDRWDDADHDMPVEEPETEYDEYGEADLRRYSLPEHFWHDVHCKVEGPAVDYVLDNFHARWNHGVLYRDVWWRDITKHRYIRRGGGKFRRRVEYTVRSIEGVLDEDRHIFERITKPPQVYQDRMRDEKSIHTREETGEEGAPKIIEASGLDSVPSLSGTKIQVVRSMPAGQYEGGKQRPEWNLSGERWERSTKDCYLIGIRAARDYIYLENQWISDEHIWAELKAAMRRNCDNPNFRIIIVIPRRPLSAAGYGTDQDVNLKPHVKAVLNESKHADQFGMYCLEGKVPESRLADVGLSQADIDDFGAETAQIYVHSKVIVVDDTWGMIGSANAGGISLLGMTDPRKFFTTGRGSAPDTELSVIIHDPKFGKEFRESLWKEHLQESSIPGTPHAAADMFREKAEEKGHRIKPAILFHKAMKKGAEAMRRVPVHVMVAVKEHSKLVASRPGVVPLTAQSTVAFTISAFKPGPVFKLTFVWTLEDSKGKKWPLHAVRSGDNTSVYLPLETVAALRGKIGAAQDAAKVICRIMVTPRGVEPPEPGSKHDKYSVAVELPVTLEGN